ncbi:MAG: hypothetical protein ACSHYC_01265 [Alphaproteobacteria bacterium]
MGHTPEHHTGASNPNIKDIRWKPPERYSSAAKIHVVLGGKDSISGAVPQ